jgi:hypothetical protein
LDLARDTYIVAFYTDVDPLKDEDRLTDIYAESLSELIVSKMGVN